MPPKSSRRASPTPSSTSPRPAVSLRANNLRIVAELLQSTTRFIANEQAYADPWKKQKMDDLVMMLQGALAAEGKVGLMMNVSKEDLPAVVKVLPALKTPTISSLSDPEWVAVNTIIDEDIVRHIVPQLKNGRGTRHRGVSAEQDHRLTAWPLVGPVVFTARTRQSAGPGRPCARMPKLMRWRNVPSIGLKPK